VPAGSGKSFTLETSASSTSIVAGRDGDAPRTTNVTSSLNVSPTLAAALGVGRRMRARRLVLDLASRARPG
jgi:hypothetical protein